MDDNFQDYLNRVARLVSPETYQSQLEHIQESPKFVRQPTGEFLASPFPGYSVITPPCGEEPENGEFYENLQKFQQQLLDSMEPGLLIPVPADSFHFTLADLIWDSAYRDAAKNPEFDQKLHSCMGAIFAESASLGDGKPSQWMVLGTMVRARAVGVCLIPTEEHSYHQVTELRRAIYQNQDLMGLGIEQQYHFTAHITLGYFGEISPNIDRQNLIELLTELNDQWLETTQSMQVKQAELRKFDDMTRYYRESDWPVFEF